MVSIDQRKNAPWLTAVAVIALAMSGLLIGYEPSAGDPSCLYRPIKTELAAALARGTLPFWSDRFGLGMPLAAESHAAAFYPPNWVAYRVLSVSAAYRLMMWLHYVAIAAATFAYARVLGITPWGSALSAISFTLCGFQAGHSCHEPFYHVLAYLPLTLYLTERHLAEGGTLWLGCLALALGAQFTLGHFQIQMWTAGLVVLTTLVRTAPLLKNQPRARSQALTRAAGIFVAAGLAVAIASPQLGITLELTRFSNFSRPIQYLTNYALPPGHWAQPILPGLFDDFIDGPNSPYWNSRTTTSDESRLYVGTIPLIFAIIGLAKRGDKALGFWKWAGLIGFILATMPQWWLEGFQNLLRLPGLGLFRAPGRYTLLTSMALCLLAGRGFDRSIAAKSFRRGLAAALVAALIGFVWGIAWSGRDDVLPYLGQAHRLSNLVIAGFSWILAFAAVIYWRRGRLPHIILCLAACSELLYLYYYQRPRLWSWPVDVAAESPTLKRLKTEEHVGLVAGLLQNLPVSVGLTAGHPNLGITAPPPNYLLEPTSFQHVFNIKQLYLYNRLGITHGVFEGARSYRASEVIYLGEDKALDALMPSRRETVFPRIWRVERYPPTFPEARIAKEAHIVDGWIEIFPAIVKNNDPNQVWYPITDAPPETPGPRATRATLTKWNGMSGEVEHDGDCDLVIRRTFYPGWTATVNNGPPVALHPADGGLLSLRLTGKGPSRVDLSYKPTRLSLYLKISGVSIMVAAGLAIAGWVGKQRTKRIAT